MNNPLLLTSVALLVGVAARPINPERGDDLAEIARSPAVNGENQAFLSRMASEDSTSKTISSLQLHDIHETNALQPSDEVLAGSASPKLKGTVPDPGLASPYIAAQRFLASFGDKELGSPALSPTSLEPATPSPFAEPQSEENGTVPRPTEVPEYSPAVVGLVISSVASLVLLGLTVAVIYVTQFVRRTLLGQNIWSAVSRGGRKKGQGLQTSEKEKLRGREEKMIEEGEMTGDDEKALIAAREVPADFRPPPSIIEKEEEEHFEDAVDDPDDMPLPEASVPAMREKGSDRRVAASFVAWTYDNWVTHFMFAVFGWIGVLFGGRGQ